MRKKLMVISIICSLFAALSAPVYADNTQLSAKNEFKINYETEKGHKNKSKSEMVNEMISDGLSKEEAEYYAKLDILMAKLEQQGEKINFDEIESYPRDYVALHELEIKEKALNFDKRAIKSLFERSSILVNGSKDLEKVQKSQSTDRNDKITIKYPDGSSVTREGSLILEKATDEYNTDTALLGPWSFGGADDMYEQGFATSSGEWVGATGVIFKSGTYYAKVNDTFRFKVYNNGYTDRTKWSVEFISDTGSSAGYGVVSTDESLSNNVGTKVTGNNNFIQGYTDIKFTLSADVSGSISFFDGVAEIGFSISPSAWWHEYAITEVSGSASILHWSAYFK